MKWLEAPVWHVLYQLWWSCLQLLFSHWLQCDWHCISEKKKSLDHRFLNETNPSRSSQPQTVKEHQLQHDCTWRDNRDSCHNSPDSPRSCTPLQSFRNSAVNNRLLHRGVQSGALEDSLYWRRHTDQDSLFTLRLHEKVQEKRKCHTLSILLCNSNSLLNGAPTKTTTLFILTSICYTKIVLEVPADRWLIQST